MATLKNRSVLDGPPPIRWTLSRGPELRSNLGCVRTHFGDRHSSSQYALLLKTGLVLSLSTATVRLVSEIKSPVARAKFVACS